GRAREVRVDVHRLVRHRRRRGRDRAHVPSAAPARGRAADAEPGGVNWGPEEAPMTQAADHDVAIPYMQRTRDYYVALGFTTPYRWAHHADVPFQPLAKPLAESRLALITTASPYQPGVGDQGPGARYNAAAKFYQVYSDSTETMP